ncbi:unnamed protein product [Durusdinium trenchii]|uniref:Glycosyltransferase subfamily 4-like N-terminal domain-containing protein n=1 Tax=Durusdinium trenchii TaxID=1381693 RepID=A0ABP0NR13_9DINO
MSPSSALAAVLEERPKSEAILLAGRRYSSLATLQNTVVDIVLEQEPGMHLRFEDDEDAMKTLLSFHPEGDRHFGVLGQPCKAAYCILSISYGLGLERALKLQDELENGNHLRIHQNLMHLRLAIFVSMLCRTVLDVALLVPQLYSQTKLAHIRVSHPCGTWPFAGTAIEGAMWKGSMARMEERLRAEMAMTTRPYDMWFSLRCLGLMSLFGCLSAIFYPVLWIGVVILSMVPQIGQLYAPPLVILTAFGTVYGLIMIAIYYMNTRGNISALHMAVSVLVASFGLFTASMAEKALEEGRQAEKGTGKWKIRLVAQWKFTVTPILALASLLPFGGPTALYCASLCVLSVKGLRWCLLYSCWAGHYVSSKSGGPMRVLLTGDSFPPKLDGVQNFARNTIQALVRDGHKVHVFCSNGSPETPFAPENYGATVTRGPGVEIQPKHKITLPSPHFLMALMRFNPHIIQFFDFTPAAFFLVPFLWWLGLPVVISHHSRIDLYATYVPGIIGDYAPQVMRAACEVVFPLVTGHLLIDGNQKDQSWFAGHSNIRFWSTGCDLDFFHPSKKDASVRESFSNGRPDLPLVVFVGRMSPEKQVDKIADLVKEANPPGAPELCRFAIIGHGDSWESIHQEIGHRPDVNMPGVVTGEKLASLVASSDIFFSPTVTGTLDLVFIESQAAGIAVVGPRAVAVPLVVTEGVNGCLYTPLDMKDAKRAIKEVIPQLEKMKVEARKNAEANFKWSKSSDEAIQFYKDVLQYTADRAA